MGVEKVFHISSRESSKRIDHFLALHLPLSRSAVQRLIKSQYVTVNGEPVKQNYKIRSGDEIRVYIPGITPIPLIPEPIPLDILYEDEYLIVLNKPAGLVVHPAPGHERGTLVNALLYHCKDLKGIGGRERPGIVHRLDKDTSGVLVVAKTDHVHRHLSNQFKWHTVQRIYIALVKGVMEDDKGTIELPIGRDKKDRKKISPRTLKPRMAITNYKVLKRFKDFTLVELKPETGRTHQLRVHLAYLQHPIVGDPIYGGREKIKAPRMMLHARYLGFVHPVKGEYMEFEAPLPEEMKKFIEGLPI